MKFYAALIALGVASADEAKNPNVFSIDHDALAKSTVAPATTLTFMPSGIVVHTDTGKVDIPEGWSADKASIEFWRVLTQVFPQAREQICQEAKP